MTRQRVIGPPLKFITDQNFRGEIVDSVNRRNNNIDIISVRDIGMEEAPDPEILEWAAHQGRVVLSHDVNTMRGDAYGRVIAGLPMPGLFLVIQDEPAGPIIQDILDVAESSFEGEWENRVEYLPFR